MRAPILWVAAGALFALGAPVDAQQARGRGPGRMQLERQVQERFAQVVRRQLGLEDPQVRAIGEVTRSFQEERMALLRRERQLRIRIGPRSGGPPGAAAPPPLPDDEARTVLEEMAALREAEAELYRREQQHLLEVLSPAQLVRYYVLRDTMAERIRQLRGPPGGPGGPGGPRLR